MELSLKFCHKSVKVAILILIFTKKLAHEKNRIGMYAAGHSAVCKGGRQEE